MMRNSLLACFILFLISFNLLYGSDLDYPPSVDITVSQNCSTFDVDSLILNITCLTIDTDSYWMQFKLVDTKNLQLTLENFGMNDSSSNGLNLPPSTDLNSLIECATYNLLENKLHVPCVKIGDNSFWLDFQLTDNEPIVVQLTGWGGN